MKWQKKVKKLYKEMKKTMWIRSQDKNKLLKCQNIQYRFREKYTDKYIALEEDVKRNFNNYMNPKTNAKIQNKYEALEYLSERVEKIKLYEIYNYGEYDSNIDVLGSYKTEERALEVLDEIQENIETRVVADNLMVEFTKTYIKTANFEGYKDKLKKLSCVYQMPKD